MKHTLKELDALREQFKNFKREERELRDMPGILDNSDHAIEAMLSKLRPIDGAPFLRGQPLALPMVTYYGPDNERITVPDVLAIVHDILSTVIPKQYEPFWRERAKLASDLAGTGVGDEERTKRLAALKQKKLAHEFAEEKMVRELRKEGVEVDRRKEADPRAVLHLLYAVDLPEPKEAWRYG